MDHFVIPEAAEHIEVPYICQERYQGAYEDYPQRQGWTSKELNNDPNFGGRPPRQIAAFFQNWLFFGTLARVFKSAGVQWDIDDFIDPERHLVTTANLPRILKTWHHQIAAVAPTRKKQPSVSGLLQTANSFVSRRFDPFNSYLERSGADLPEWPLIALSIAALGWTLEKAQGPIHMMNIPPTWSLQPWGNIDILETRMIAAGWSHDDMKRGIELDSLYYSGFLKSPRQQWSRADPKRALGQDNYVTRHDRKCRKDCHFWNISKEVLDIVKSGKTPLMKWENSKLSVLKSDLKDVYVAISHVWSDGMGNPKSNALPACQLGEVQSMVDRLYSRKRSDQKRRNMIFGPTNSLEPRDPSRKPVGFWMDTLCVPVNDEDARKIAIKKMRDIYQYADRTLVLDFFVRELRESTDIAEKISRIYLSNWQIRLWTLQEGVLAHNLYFQFKYGPQSLENLQDIFMEEKKSRPELQFYSTLGKALVEVPALSLRLKSPAQSSPSFSALLPLVAAVIARTTTRKSDETICLATILAMDPTPLLDLPGKNQERMTQEEKQLREEEACEKRMEKFLQMIGTFELKTIFSDLPRLKSEGFGWAPRTFLGRPGITIAWQTERSGVDRSAVIKPDGSGLLLTCPGIILGSVWPGLGCNITVQQDATFHCRVTLIPEEGQSHVWDSDPATRYVVLSYIPVLRHDDFYNQSEGIVGIMRGYDEAERYFIVRYVCRAQIRWETEMGRLIEPFSLPQPNNSETVSGEWLETSTEWCLV